MRAKATDDTQQRESGQFVNSVQKYGLLETEATEEQKEGYNTVPHRC